MGFNEMKIGGICNICSSKRIYLSEYKDNGVPFYRGKEITEKASGKKISNELYISKERFDVLKNKYGCPKKGDLLITAVGTLGNCYRVRAEEFYFKDGNIIWLNKFDEKIINNHFLYYIIKSIHFQEKLNNIAIGSTQKAITIDSLKNITIKIPSLEIQQKIVKILFTIDSKIELNNKINDNLYELAKNKFKEWLLICDEEVQIKEIAEEILDYRKNNNSKVKLMNSSDITEGKFPEFEFVDNKNLKGHFKKGFQKYDILYSQIRPRNKHFGYVLMDDYGDYIASTRLMVVRNKRELLSSSILYFYLTSDEAINDFTSKTESRSGTFPQGNYEDLSSYIVKYSKNQNDITKILDLCLEKIYKNNKQNETLIKLRDTLLPKLMNGKIDLENIKV